VTVDDIHFLGYPTTVSRRAPHADETAVHMIHVCFLLHAGAGPAAVDAYLRLIRQLTGALAHEEVRCGFVTDQVEALLDIRDRASIAPPTPEAMTQLMVQRCALAHHVQHVYDAIAAHTHLHPHRAPAVHVRINNWVNVTWCAAPKEHPAAAGGLEGEALRPYQTLLLAPEAMAAALPRDCSPALYRLVMHAHPLKSFADLAEELDTPLAHVYRLAAHLVYWQRAHIIHKLSRTSVFVVAPHAPLDPRAPAAAAFARDFPKRSCSYHDALARYSHPRPLGDALAGLTASQAKDAINILVWLLRRRLVVALHTYLYLNVPYPYPADTGAPPPPPPPPPAGPNAPIQDWEYSAIQARGGSGDALRLLRRLAPYMRGANHVEDIMWRENIPRTDIMDRMCCAVPDHIPSPRLLERPPRHPTAVPPVPIPTPPPVPGAHAVVATYRDVIVVSLHEDRA
jgi:hypothetical protein